MAHPGKTITVEGDKSRTNVTAYRKHEEMTAGECDHLHMYTSHTVLNFETMLILVVLKMERKSES